VQVEHQVDALSNVLPPESTQMIAAQLHKLVTASSGSLGISAVVALLFALWSASRGMSGMITPSISPTSKRKPVASSNSI